MESAGTVLLPHEVLASIPQQAPFRYVDEMLEVDAAHAVGATTWSVDAPFYAGHFPGEPVTPGALLCEAMAQAGPTALAIYLLATERPRHELPLWRPLLTEVQVELVSVVPPGQRVVTCARTVFWRRHKLRCKVEMHDAAGRLVARGAMAAILRMRKMGV